uniref:NDUFA4 mitochondrial complex associated like 2a n=1 Tax=Astatotilapia calliptera TaxID=8154 RepID=A0AAX7T1Q9_ASTCA
MMFRAAVEHAKKHPGLIPQFFFICLGMGGASLYLIRLARGPHVTWDKTNNPEPWNKLDPTYQYKVRQHMNSNLTVFYCRLIVKSTYTNTVFFYFPPQFVAITTDYKNLKKEGPDF